MSVVIIAQDFRNQHRICREHAHLSGDQAHDYAEHAYRNGGPITTLVIMLHMTVMLIVVVVGMLTIMVSIIMMTEHVHRNGGYYHDRCDTVERRLQTRSSV
jgi:hypothetical protein